MNAPDHAGPQPVIPPVAPPTKPGLIDFRRPLPPSKIETPLRALALCLGSIAAMTPWPLLGILLAQPYFEKGSEAFMFFGGITLFPLMILALFGSPPEWLLIALIMLAWLTAAVLPNLWFRRRIRSWMAIGLLLGAQSAFSLAQAAMGAMLILGKYV